MSKQLSAKEGWIIERARVAALNAPVEPVEVQPVTTEAPIDDLAAFDARPTAPVAPVKAKKTSAKKSKAKK